MAFFDKLKEFFGKKKGADTGGVDPRGEFLKSYFDFLRTAGSHLLGGYLRAVDRTELSEDYLARLKDYEAMDDFDLVSTALDIYADEATFTDPKTKEEIWVESSDSNVENLLNNLLARTVRPILWDIARAIAKYGNDFNRIVFNDEGVEGLDYISPFRMRVFRIEGKFYYVYVVDEGERVDRAEVLEAVKKNEYVLKGRNGIVFEDWMIIHFRNPGKYRDDLYGYSILESARWTWKRLVYLENLLLFNRVKESLGRYVHYVNVGEASLAQIPNILASYANLVKGKRNVLSGDYSLSYNVLSAEDDIYIPVRGEKDPTRIEFLEGRTLDVAGDMDYYQGKFAGAVRVPRDYLTFETNANKMSLGMQDMRFAKAVMRLQKAIIDGVEKLCDIELIARGYDINKVRYEVKMAQPSSVFDLAVFEVERERAEVISSYSQFLPMDIVLKRFGDFSEAEIKEIMKFIQKQSREMYGR